MSRSRSRDWCQPCWELVTTATSRALLLASFAWIVSRCLVTSQFRFNRDQHFLSYSSTNITVPVSSDTGPFYVFLLTSCSITFQLAYCQLFYKSYLTATLSNIVQHVSDSRYFRDTEHCIVFTNTLYRSDKSTFLMKLFLGHLACQLGVTGVTGAVIVWSFSSLMLEEALVWLCWCLSLALIGVQACVQILGLGWTLVTRNPALSAMMKLYSGYLAKVDVARGRSVPSPVDKSPVQVLSSLNPYNTSQDLKLLLDLIATKSGSGLALRCLAKLETDFSDSWSPTGLQAEFEGECLLVYWKDPVVINYVTTNKSLRIHYGVELEEVGCITKTRIISHQEVRFMKQTWRTNNSGSVDLGNIDDFIYHESFPVSPLSSAATVRVWTVINGQLISFVEKRILNHYRDTSDEASSSPHNSHSDYHEERPLDDSNEDEEGVIKVEPNVENTQKNVTKYLFGQHNLDVTKLRTSSEINLNHHSHNEFSRMSSNRKSLPMGHINLAFISEDDSRDPYMLI